MTNEKILKLLAENETCDNPTPTFVEDVSQFLKENNAHPIDDLIKILSKY